MRRTQQAYLKEKLTLGGSFVNKAVLVTRLERLCEYLGILESVLQYDLTPFVRDPFIHGTAERNLHLAIECLLYIGNQVISDKGYPKPETYADIFRLLGDREIIPPPFLHELEGMAAFINVLVHDYLRLDWKRSIASFGTSWAI